MLRARQGTRWVISLFAACVVACGEVQRTTAPPSPEVTVGPVAPQNMWVETTDPCFWTVVYTCHELGMYNLTYDNDGTVGFGDSGWSCPNGCTSYPLGSATTRLIRDIINNHIQNNANCSWVTSFLNAALVNNRVRHYGINDGNYGDAHWFDGDTSVMHADIHIKDETFLSTYDLGMTVIHEAAHVHFDNRDQAFAENWATTCYRP
jgi:hypothetical protein